MAGGAADGSAGLDVELAASGFQRHHQEALERYVQQEDEDEDEDEEEEEGSSGSEEVGGWVGGLDLGVWSLGYLGAGVICADGDEDEKWSSGSEAVGRRVLRLFGSWILGCWIGVRSAKVRRRRRRGGGELGGVGWVGA